MITIQRFFDSLYSRLIYNPYNFIQRKVVRYYWIWRMGQLRKLQRPINFVFVLSDLSTWKTEGLYWEMKSNSRFNPLIAVTDNDNLQKGRPALEEYLRNKQIPFFCLDKEKTIVDQMDVDMLIYQRPYKEEPLLHQYDKNLKAVMVHVLYGYHSLTESWMINQGTASFAWQDYYENEFFAEYAQKHSNHKGHNIVCTGIPTMDLLFKSKDLVPDPWKNHDGKKRIIWAPHHSIGDQHVEGLAYGTFLDIADDMLVIAKEYSNDVYFAFKPHPVLYDKLVSVWGKERTDTYYDTWRSLENAQFENGEYLGLFKHSDAMIHDCATFTMEYLMTGNPAMYIVGPEHETSNLIECARMSFENHYQGYNISDIRRFVENIIKKEDPRREERLNFVNQYLRPPFGKTSSENIINAILGIEDYA